MAARTALADRAATSHPRDLFMRPRSVALIGASDDTGRIADRPLRYLMAPGFDGALYPKRVTAQGQTASASDAELPAPPDFTIPAVPAAPTPAALRDCAMHGMPAALDAVVLRATPEEPTR